MSPISLLTWNIALSAALTSCTMVGTDYQTPTIPTPSAYKEATNSRNGFRSDWWRSFQDPTLNSLQTRLLSENQDLNAALARYDQSLAALGVARSEKFPQGDLNAGVSRNENSSNVVFGNSSDYFDLYEVTGSLSYELDLWGRVRRVVNASTADTQESAALLEDVRVALQAQLARDYFALRFLDAEAAVLREAVKTREQSLQLTKDRVAGGTASDLDSSRAQTELASAQADLYSLVGPRAQLENSIAVLIGTAASDFSLPQKSQPKLIPQIPAGLPGDLLRRRPDIAAAERRLAASSERIGVAQGEFFPKVRLVGNGGLSSINSNDFLDASSRAWSAGPSVDLPLFTGGRLRSNLIAAKARQRENLANFQQAALRAFADVESSLALISALKREEGARQDAVTASRKSFELANIRYEEGTDDYLDVVDSQRVLLTSERAQVQTRGRQFAATIQLIQALGGGFSRDKN